MSQAAFETDVWLVLVSCGNQEEAETIAERIVTERLAACVNIIGAGHPVKSFYLWEGNLQKDSELLLLIKTKPDLLSKLQERILALHSYTTPELIALPVAGGSNAYLTWVLNNTQ